MQPCCSISIHSFKFWFQRTIIFNVLLIAGNEYSLRSLPEYAHSAYILFSLWIYTHDIPNEHYRMCMYVLYIRSVWKVEYPP